MRFLFLFLEIERERKKTKQNNKIVTQQPHSKTTISGEKNEKKKYDGLFFFPIKIQSRESN